MPPFTPKQFEEILAQMVATVVARAKLTDITDASVFKHLLAASARQDDELYYQMGLLLQTFSIDTAAGQDLDDRAAEIQPGDLTRRSAVAATGQVVFSRAGTTGTIVVPTGTKVKTVGDVVFVTLADATITAASPEQITGHGVGRDSAPVPVIAELPGVSGNVVASTIIRFVVRPSGVDEAVNLAPTLFGADLESDDQFRARIKAYVRTLARCTPEALETGVVGLALDTGATIRVARAWEDPITPGVVTLFVDDGTGQIQTTEVVTGEIVTVDLAGPPPGAAVGGEVRLYLRNIAVRDASPFTLTSSIRGVLTPTVDYDLVAPWGLLLFRVPLLAAEVLTADYTRHTGLLELGQRVVDGDPTDRATYPGLRAAGVVVTVRAPAVRVIPVTVAITPEPGYEVSLITADVADAVIRYVNGLGIGDDVVRNEIVAQVMGVPGVYNCAVLAPAADVTILDDQIARNSLANVVVS